MESVPDMDDLLDSLEDLPEVQKIKTNDSSSIDRPVKLDDNSLFMESETITKSTLIEGSILKEKTDNFEVSSISGSMEESPKKKDLENMEKSFQEHSDGDFKFEDSSTSDINVHAEDFQLGSQSNDPDSVKNEISNLSIESSSIIPPIVDSTSDPESSIVSEDVTGKFEFASTSLSESAEIQAPIETVKITLNVDNFIPERSADILLEDKLEEKSTESDSLEKKSLDAVVPLGESTEMGKEEGLNDERKLKDDSTVSILVEEVLDRVEVEGFQEESSKLTMEISKENSSENQSEDLIHETAPEETCKEASQETVMGTAEEYINPNDQTNDSINREVLEASKETVTGIPKRDTPLENQTNDCVRKETEREIMTEVPNQDVSSDQTTNDSTQKNASEESVRNKNPELTSSVRDPSKPVGFDSSSNLSSEEEIQLQRELEEMETGNVSSEVLEAVKESSNDAVVDQGELQPTSLTDMQNPEEHPEPSPSAGMQNPKEDLRRTKASVVLSTHDLSEFNFNPILTESERQLGKVRPYWIPDEDCTCCMLCSLKFTVINRRHHCRCCGRVLCNSCCSIKRPLPYIEDPEKKQKVCEPCSRTLDRIEEFERNQREATSGSSDQRTSRSRGVSESHDGLSDSNDPGPSSPTYSTSNRKKSVLKSKKNESIPEEPGPEKKRSVKFLDGVHPGHEAESSEEPGPSKNSGAQQASDQPNEAAKKIQKRPNISRRFREKRIEEEQISLIKDDVIYLADSDSQLNKSSMDVVCRKLLNGEKLTFAIRKNYCMVGQLVQTLNGKVWSFSTRGMSAVGADELFIAFEAGEDDAKNLEEIIKEHEVKDEIKEESEDVKEKKQNFIYSILYLFEYFFIEALIPASDNLDEKVGIRRCGSRMTRFYNIPSGEIGGIPASVVLFHRPQGQDFSSFSIPFNVPFLVGSFILKQELVWAMTIPNRLLLRIGLQSSHFPIPIVNKRNREPVYSDSSENSVLKVFNDFKNWAYRFPKIIGSTVEIEDGCIVKVYIPTFGTEDLKQVIDCNRNMLAWSTELTDHPDSYLVAIQNMETRAFRTEIFTDVGGTRQTIGANFVVIDGSLKNSNEKFLMTIIEDGVVLRFPLETMEEIVKNLQNGLAFTIENNSMSVQMMFIDPYEPQSKTGALVSPIDEMHLLGHYQYGLTLTRQFRSQILIPNIADWALRLSTVINADRGRFPLQLQPRYFEICEQVGILIASTMEQFIQPLTLSEQRQICIRIRIEADSVTYETAKWHGLDQEQYQWTEILDDKLIPYMYQLCPLINLQLYIELYFSIISTRLLQNIDY